jgi:hypothetical protein
LIADDAYGNCVFSIVQFSAYGDKSQLPALPLVPDQILDQLAIIGAAVRPKEQQKGRAPIPQELI